jgi:ABC-type phosphate/phosphonate transport system substrate-binding protein
MMRALGILALVLALLPLATDGQESRKPIHFVLTKKVFMDDVAKDVLPQAQLAADKVGERIGQRIVVEESSDQIADLLEGLKSAQVEFVVSDGLDYVRLKLGRMGPGISLPPLNVRALAAVAMPPDPKELPTGCTRAAVITRNLANINSPQDLRGKRFVYGPRSEADCSMVFLNSFLSQHGLGTKEQVFSSVRRLSCEDACLIALQRGSADVTCVSEIVVLAKTVVVGDMGKDIQSRWLSGPYPAYVCFYMEGAVEPHLAMRMREELLRLHESPEGRKLLEMFHVKQFVPVEEDAFGPLELLVGQAGLEPPNPALPVPSAQGSGSRNEGVGVPVPPPRPG